MRLVTCITSVLTQQFTTTRMKNKIKDHLPAARNSLTRLRRQLAERNFCWGIKTKEKGMMRHSQKGITEDQLYTEVCDNQLFRDILN